VFSRISTTTAANVAATKMTETMKPVTMMMMMLIETMMITRVMRRVFVMKLERKTIATPMKKK
jgi:hypothetical protein